jgi:hypothetical protein
LCPQPVVFSFGPAIFDRDIAAFDKALFQETFAESGHEVRDILMRQDVHEPDHRHWL